MRATLILADGREYEGQGFGAEGVSYGELVFNTAMTGYQEVLTDPSYKRQLVTLTAPEVGNYGCNADDDESAQVQVAGLVIRNLSPVVSNHGPSSHSMLIFAGTKPLASTGSTPAPLRRSLRRGARWRRSSTAMRTATPRAVATEPGMEGADLAKEVTAEAPYRWRQGTDGGEGMTGAVVAVDPGVKRNILRLLVDAGCRVTVVPAHTSAEAIRALKPQGVFLSNGPGDPAAVTYGAALAKELMGTVPMFGICLGHQLMALAQGARTFKMSSVTGRNTRCAITPAVALKSQAKIGFAVAKEGLPDLEVPQATSTTTPSAAELRRFERVFGAVPPGGRPVRTTHVICLSSSPSR